ncbi:hypothetical protein BKA60DRAFT_646452 [Fusarium oxysporum]|nr:hypothetical protein BKA60DRAFT_646452 [Fusarium oxysporum]
MSVPVVRSIVENTFAFDVTTNAIKPFQLPSANLDSETPGVYVVGIRMKNQDGQFLNINELELLIHDMKLYIEGAKPSTWSMLLTATWEHRDPNSGPCFIEKAEEVPRIKALINRFEGMCDRSLGPTGRLYISQSPLYVGCSKDLKKRMRAYARHSVKGINKPLGLTVCILRKHNRSPELVTGCVLRILKRQQLPMSEQLVYTIARSLVYEHGFNAVESGGTGPKSLPTDAGLKDNIKYIICGTQVLISTLKESLGEADLRQRFLLHLIIGVNPIQWLSDVKQGSEIRIADHVVNTLIAELNGSV